MSRDDGWRFSRARPQPRTGRHDRAPAVARATATRSGTPAGPRRCALLRVRGVPAHVPPRGRRASAVEFLLLDRLFPARSSTRSPPPTTAWPSSIRAPRVRASTTRRAAGSAGSCRGARVPAPRRGDGRPAPLLRATAARVRRVHAAVARRYFRETRVDRVERVSVSWRLKVRHTTTYRYSGRDARVVQRGAHLAARHTEPVHARAPGRGAPGREPLPVPRLLGSRVHAFDLHRPHTRAHGRRTSLVETAERTPNLDETVAWDAIDAPGLTDRFFEYLDETPMTESDDAIRGRRQAPRGADPAAALARLGEWLRGHVEYEPGTTNVSTTAVEVLRAGRGVCQDFAHWRSRCCGPRGFRPGTRPGTCIPTSWGVRSPSPTGREPCVAQGVGGRLAPARSHQWVAGRRASRPRRPGREYSDVAPLKGVYNGGPSHSLDVAVELTASRREPSEGTEDLRVVSPACLLRRPRSLSRSPSTASRPSTTSRPARCSCSTCARSSGSPAPTSAATRRRAARARCCSTASR